LEQAYAKLSLLTTKLSADYKQDTETRAQLNKIANHSYTRDRTGSDNSQVLRQERNARLMSTAFSALFAAQRPFHPDDVLRLEVRDSFERDLLHNGVLESQFSALLDRRLIRLHISP